MMSILRRGLLLTACTVAASVSLLACDAAGPEASAPEVALSSDATTADAVLHRYRIDGPSSVIAGSCDYFTVEDASGNSQSTFNWKVSGSGYLTAATTSRSLVLATAVGRYTVSANVGSASGPRVSKTVSVRWNPQGTVEC